MMKGSACMELNAANFPHQAQGQTVERCRQPSPLSALGTKLRPTFLQAHGAHVVRVLCVAPLVEQPADLVHPALALVALDPPLLTLAHTGWSDSHAAGSAPALGAHCARSAPTTLHVVRRLADT